MLKLLKLKEYGGWAPLPLRIALGAMFAAHGYLKLFADFGAVTNFFSNQGLPWPAFFVLIVGLVEFVGGLLLIMGGLVRLVSLLLAINMLVAILVVAIKGTYVNGWERELVFLAGTLTLMFLGAGRWAIDKEQTPPGQPIM